MARHQFAVIALAAVALLSSFWLLLDVVYGYANMARMFGVGSFEQRFLPLRKVLAPHSVVGYVSDNPSDDATSLGEFYLTQYTLAPVIVTYSSNERLVVVNYHGARPDEAWLRSKNLTPIQMFGNGALLCRNNAR